MVKHSRDTSSCGQVDRGKVYDRERPWPVSRACRRRSSSESGESPCAFVDPKKNDQLVRGAGVAAEGLGKKVK